MYFRKNEKKSKENLNPLLNPKFIYKSLKKPTQFEFSSFLKWEVPWELLEFNFFGKLPLDFADINIFLKLKIY